MPFSDLFGGSALLPANQTYLSLVLSAPVSLRWPMEQQIGGSNVVADIIDVNGTAPGLSIIMPDARIGSQGLAALFNNVGANTVTVLSATGATIISLVSGSCWMVYLVDNTTEGGTWRVFQYGASVSVANAAALAGAGLKAIGTTLNTRIAVFPKSSTPYTILESERATLLNWTSGVGTFTLPNAGLVGSDWYVSIRNSGTGDLTIVPPGGSIDGFTTKVFPPGYSSYIVTDGLNFFTLGFTSGSASAGGEFNFVTVDVTGSGDYLLAGLQLGQIGYRFTGTLSADRNIIVPKTTDEYWVDNATINPFRLFLKTSTQTPGVEVLQGNQAILYCDGNNVLSAISSTIVFPISVAQGGTGAINAGSARTNLGATTVGNAVFTASDASAGRTALGAGAVGSSLFTATTTAAALTTLGATATGSAIFTAADGASVLSTIGGVPTSRKVIAGTGLSGGGSLTGDVTLNVTVDTSGFVPTTRNISTQYSLAGGGNLSADRTLSLVNDSAAPGAWALYGTDGSGVRGWQTTGFLAQFNGLGIGTPGASGEIRCTGEISSLYTSDRRFKENLLQIQGALYRVMEIKTYEFDWTKEHLQERGGEHSYFLPRHTAGFVAQEVELIWPMAVRTKPDGTKVLDPNILLPLLWGAVRELISMVVPR